MKPAPRWALPSVRPHEDHVFDRRQVQAPRGVEPSRTNRPSPRAPSGPRRRGRKAEGEEKTHVPPPLCGPQGARTRAPRARSKSAAREPAVLAPGAHPVPYRTRKLSPWAPRVLRPQGRGRVGRRRLARGALRADRAERTGGAPRGAPLAFGGLRTSWVFWAALMLLPVSGTLRIELCPPCCCPLGR